MSSYSHKNSPKIVAVLGPTNTGKTFYAMDRMLGHASGMIGFPLRLLARENYDKAVKLRGKGQVALVTGEEKIIPPGAQYFLCTIEAMPMDKKVEFLAIDEVQMCADPDRGHVFTDRLLHARGLSETLFLGAETMGPMIRRLVRGVEFMSRPRLSNLSYSGVTKVNRLKPRSAIVAFTVNDVYAMAELVRQQRGGAAVVLGALSPRTRNAQVEMYQNGEVDYLVATDAIGMGLNMDLNHVSFAATRKFDGNRYRQLSPAELGQTAGRAGRHTNDGTFGTTADIGPLDAETISSIENHQFDMIRQVYWRNPKTNTRTVEDLTASLREPSGVKGLVRVRTADDERALNELSRDQIIMDRASNPDTVQLLWDVCQIPDFEKEWTIGHGRMLEQFFNHLIEGEGRLPTDWIAKHVDRIDSDAGDIDALSTRIARIRTWTYLSNKSNWLDDPIHWQERTRDIENMLSDALHEKLTQRFVDKRTTMLVSKLRDNEDLVAAVNKEGDVLIEGHYAGYLSGLRFVPDEAQFSADRQVLAGAAATLIRGEIKRRVNDMITGDTADFNWRSNGLIEWNTEVIAKVRRGNDMLNPVVDVLFNDYMESQDRERLARRLAQWMQSEQNTALAALNKAAKAKTTGAARGLVYQLKEQLGSIAREGATEQVDALSRDDRRQLKSLGVFIGRSIVYMPALLKPAAVAMRARLWNIWQQPAQSFEPPTPGLITIDIGTGQNIKSREAFLDAIGFQVFNGQAGKFAVRLDMVERITNQAWTIGKEKGLKNAFAIDPMLMSLAGAGEERTGAILLGNGFRKITKDDATLYRVPQPWKKPEDKKEKYDPKKKTADTKTKRKTNNKPFNKTDNKKPKQQIAKPAPPPKIDEDSPFAVLKNLTFSS